ncbi:MAG: ABC transporter permease, partial [Acidobacteriaceae bacterium]|jgi:ABC-2 type transport system permease protein|nr:ABC transporter permease [Acidobacteriaceae bacterium]
VQFEETPGGYDRLVAPRLDPRVENGIYDGMHEALVSARVAAMGLDRARLTTIMNVRRPVSVTLTSTGEQPSNNGLATMLPFAFVGLMFIGVMVGGQRLMTTTIEEKSSRVVEVLLSAISPLELMAGKILGQLAVSALALAVYLVLGGSVLSSLAMFGLVQPMHVVYLVVFYVLGYMTFGALMATIGAAVNDINEAQSLMMPVTLLIITPLVLVAPIVRAPSSMLATILSFTPPVNTFVMLIRITSLAPPPAWQIALSMLSSLAGVVAAMWFAAKVFKVGLLMFGKPPNFATLVKWVRMA